MPLFIAAGIVAPPPPKTRYQGSKYKLLDWIWQHVSRVEFDTVLDAFGGSACVSHFLKGQGKSVTYNDILIANYLCGQALVANDDETLSGDDVAYVVSHHDEVDYMHLIESKFEDIYFTRDENAWLDMVAQNIPRLGTLSKRALAYYALFQSAIAKRPYNLFHRKNLYMRTSDVPRSFGNKATWDRPFEEHFRAFARQANAAVFSNGRPCTALNMDALEITGNYDLVYIDTPYISAKGIGVDYHGFYHFLEGIADYSSWAARIDYQSRHRRLKPVDSPWTDPKRIRSSFRSLFRRFADSFLAVSYRSDGIPSVEELVSLVREVKPHAYLYTLDGSYTYVLSTNRRSTEVLVLGTSAPLPPA